MKVILLISLLTVFTIDGIYGQRDGGRTLPDDEYSRHIFTRLNGNNDSHIDFHEIKFAFTKLDKDDDGFVSKLEFVEAVQAKEHPQNAKIFGMFEKLDTDKDGKWNLVDMRRTFNIMDDDGNGELTDVEFIPAWIKMMDS
ncbi:neurocalcin-delta-like [Octopus sinensis]|uniref:Neurocalcin-delta-like n=1 Tax=Octopus sinensis TaxID=2607531 RepID=A0A6P7S6W2_9MOLL|nr:neurocalcin-delta-like [Octopus sinensis]